MRAPSVRISPRTHELVRHLAEKGKQSMQSVLDDAIERYRRERFLRAANANFAARKGDVKAWKRELYDWELWNKTVSDGISLGVNTPDPLP
jgi:predicted transcriptional regulator